MVDTITSQRNWRRAVRDPVYFARAFLGIKPHDGQVRWLKNSIGGENALVTGNRWGKSEIQAVKLLHRALFQVRSKKYDGKDYYRCANVSITQDQAGIIFAKATALISRSRPLQAMVRSIKQTPFPHIEFKNGSEIWARSSHNRGEYLLGHDFDYINFDEAAYELFGEWVVDGVIKLRLADRQGTLDFSSTPNGLNWFYKRCQMIAKENRGHLQHGSIFENPHLSVKYLTDLRGSFSESRAAQHLYGKFTSFEGRLFPEEVVQRCLSKSGLSFVGADPRVRPIMEGSDRFFIHGWDLARKVTYTVGITIDATERPFRVVNLVRMQREWPVTIKAIKDVHARYGGITIIDSTGLGDVVLSELRDIGAIGFNFGGGNRDLLLANLERAIYACEVLWPDYELPDDIGGTWSLTDEIRAMDKSYEHVGDGVCALALALWQVRQRGIDLPFLKSAVGRF
ncbi:MAG TPA: hypothetical protein DEO84_10340 [candidate division Zixibacteria bacterium]|nr:hypothetical protein [candidate division Zixibacteria bacterium]HBZ01704.1 hypothetical protein [candidate division Zixibacteria bacterium]